MTGSPPAAAMELDDVEVIGSEEVYRGYFGITRWRFRHRLYAGGVCPPVQREIFERGHAVAVVLYDAERDVLVLIEQFRAGAFVALREPHLQGAFTPWLIEVVAGIIDEGETAEEVARREAVEEAGCVVSRLEPMGVILTSPGGASETVLFYLGYCTAPSDGALHGLAEEHEDIRVLVASPDEIWARMDRWELVNGPALVGLQWFRIHQDRLRRRPAAER